MPRKLAIYIRVSTEKQEQGAEAQLMACKDWCAREGVTDYVVFEDDGISGKEANRPGLNRMFAAIDRGQIDRVLVYCLSRLSRQVSHHYMFIEEFRSKGVTLLSCSETIDTDSPEGRLLFGILATISQYQREDTARKVKNGMENARRKGVKLGRKKTRQDGPILGLLDRGLSPTEVMRELGISKGAVYRAIRARGR